MCDSVLTKFRGVIGIAQKVCAKRSKKTKEHMRRADKCEQFVSIVPTALALLIIVYPALTRWAHFCRAYGAWRKAWLY
jgi:hypothetical protein